MSEATRLYTPELLALTLRLAEYPLDSGFALQGNARSKSCGSTLTIGLDLNKAGNIHRIGIRASACAVGQAAASIFAENAIGLSVSQISDSLVAVTAWVTQQGEQPDWPGISALEPARAFPGRHGAILLAWQAASEALSHPATAS